MPTVNDSRRPPSSRTGGSVPVRARCGPSRSSTSQPRARRSWAPRTAKLPVRAAGGPRPRRGLRLTCSDVPDDYLVVLGNGGSTAFWDAAAYSLIRERSEHLSFGEFGAKFAAAAAAARTCKAPHVITAPGGSRSEIEVLEGIDVYAYPQNETSDRGHGAGAASGCGCPDGRRRDQRGRWRRLRPARSGCVLLRPAEELRRRRRYLVRPLLPRGARARRGDRRRWPLHPRVPLAEERGRQLQARPDPQHPGARRRSSCSRRSWTG